MPSCVTRDQIEWMDQGSALTGVLFASYPYSLFSGTTGSFMSKPRPLFGCDHEPLDHFHTAPTLALICPVYAPPASRLRPVYAPSTPRLRLACVPPASRLRPACVPPAFRLRPSLPIQVGLGPHIALPYNSDPP